MSVSCNWLSNRGGETAMTEKTNDQKSPKVTSAKLPKAQLIAQQVNKALANQKSRAACKGAFVLDNNELKEGAAK